LGERSFHFEFRLLNTLLLDILFLLIVMVMVVV
jgi:hypothetical protein